MANDLMDTKVSVKTKTKAEEAGIVEHNDWTLNHNCYVGVRKANGDLVEGNKVETYKELLMEGEVPSKKKCTPGTFCENDDLMDW